MRRATALVAVVSSVAAFVACGDDPVEPPGDPQLSLSADSVIVEVGGSASVDATLRNTSESPQFVSRDLSVATVNAAGAISGVGVGSTYVVATLPGHAEVRDSLRVRVEIRPKLTLSADNVSIDVGGSTAVTAAILNSSETAQYVSRNPGVATVDQSGAISGVGVGSVYVVATLSNHPLVRDSVLVMVQLPAGGEWDLRAPLLVANSELAVAEANGRLYLLGGYPMNRVTSRTVQVYDIASNSWQLGPQLPQPNNHGMAAGVNGKVYLIGGQTLADDPPGTNSYVNTVYELNPATGTWTPKAPMPTSRSSGVAIVHDGKIYVAGGRPPHEQDFAVYDPATNTWETLPNLPSPRNHMTGAAIGGRIHVVGGRIGLGLGIAKSAAHEVFDPVTRTWTTAAPMLRARSGMNGVMARGCFHVWGGEAPLPVGMTPDHDYFDPRTGKWTRLRDMPIPIHGVNGTAFVNGQIHVPGGGIAIGGSSGSLYNQVFRPSVSCE